MKTTSLSFLLVLELLSIGLLRAQPAKDSLTAGEIIEKAIAALGGRANLLTVKTLYTDMTTEMEGRQVQWITKEMLPNKGSFQIVFKGRIVYQNFFNGEKGYAITDGQVQETDEKEFKDKKYKKNIFDQLDYLDSSLWKLELIGEEKVNHQDCYKIKATLVNGLVEILYYSKITFYTLREDKISNPEKEAFETSFFYDYRKFGNLTNFSEMKVEADGKPQFIKIVNLLVNEQVTEDDFK
jgi:hypothetical protein